VLDPTHLRVSPKQLIREHGPIFKLQIPRSPDMVFIADPDLIEQVLALAAMGADDCVPHRVICCALSAAIDKSLGAGM
jgi:hypothetical protein